MRPWMRWLSAGVLLLVPVPLLGLAEGPTDLRFDFDGASPVVMDGGCGGAAGDWEPVRAMEDPGDGWIRSRPVGNESCLLLGGLSFGDGSISARVRGREALVGFALRHRDATHYLGVYLNLVTGSARVKQWQGGEPVQLGAAHFPPAPGGVHEMMAAVLGSDVAVYLDGRKILTVSGVPPAEGGAGILAAPESVAECDDVVLHRWDEGDSPMVVTPEALPPAQVGRPYEVNLACHLIGAKEKEPAPCARGVMEGSLPRGLTLEASGRIAGVPESPGEFHLALLARREGSAALLVQARIRVSAISWPRFPFDPSAKVEPALAVLYSPDDIAQHVEPADLGFPGRLLFRIHQDHPKLRIVLMSCPANRLLDEIPLSGHPASSALWRSLALDPNFAWIELGGHGYTHAPPGDLNLNHHEFATDQNGCNLDHRLLGDRAYCEKELTLAREAYRKAGIPDDRVVVMRFPGVADNPEALRAAAEAGFLMILGSRHLEEPGREWWVPYPGGGEILMIVSTSLQKRFAGSAPLEEALRSGRLAAAEVTGDPGFLAAVERGRAYVERIAADGGILNLVDHYWETFEEIGGTTPRYLILDAVLREIETRYGPRAWYSGGRDLALWLEARRRATVSWREESDGVHVEIEPPARWKKRGLSGLALASIVVHLPSGWKEIRDVRIKEGNHRFRPLDSSLYWMESRGLAISFPLRERAHLHIRRAIH